MISGLAAEATALGLYNRGSMSSAFLGIPLPALLAPALFDDAWKQADALRLRHPQAYAAFTLGWKGVAYRARSMEECGDHFVNLWTEHRSSSHEGNYLQEQAFVNYLFNACSTVDCWTFSAYAALALYSPTEIPFEDARELRVDRKRVADRCAAILPDHGISEVANEFAFSSISVQLFELRDVMAHRGSLPHTVYLGGDRHGQVSAPTNPKALPRDWASNFMVGPEAIQLFRPWITALLRRGIAEIDSLLGSVEIPASEA